MSQRAFLVLSEKDLTLKCSQRDLRKMKRGVFTVCLFWLSIYRTVAKDSTWKDLSAGSTWESKFQFLNQKIHLHI